MHVVTQPQPPSLLEGAGLTVHQIPLGTDNLGWLLVAADGAAMAVDGPEADGYLARCEALGARLVAVLNTHPHADHVGVNRALLAAGARALRVLGPAARATAIPGLTDPLGDGDRFTFGGATFETLATPGHVDGHLAFRVGDAVFTGDALFTGGCGRMFDGPADVMQASLARLRALPPATRVFCAHEYTAPNLAFAAALEPDHAAVRARLEDARARAAEGASSVPSTLALERVTNPFLRWDCPGLIAAVARQAPEAPLRTPAEVFAATRHLKDVWRAP